jgi:glyoxylase-like metal-dependent hydrolase (beta-lactamase superfamily II)
MELAFNQPDFAHNPSWVLYDNVNAEWLGFEAIRLPFTPEMYLVPLFGHTRGHCGVAVRDGQGWLFQCADAIPTNAEYQLLPNWFYRYTIGPHVPRLRTWAKLHPEVRILAGHMWKSFFPAQ